MYEILGFVSSNFKFNIKIKVLLKTVWGGIFSVLLMLSTIALVIYNCYTYFKNRTPSLLYLEIFIKINLQKNLI